MIRAAIAASVRHPRALALAWLCLAVAAGIYAAGARLEMFPQLSPAGASVWMVAPAGLSCGNISRRAPAA